MQPAKLNVFDNILERKKKRASLDYKKQLKKLKKAKDSGFFHGFGQKFEIFPSFYY